MYIAKKNTKIIAIHQVEWKCRKEAKGLDKSAYWTWLKSVTSGDPPVYDFSGEDYEIVETNAPLSYQDKDEDGNDITVLFTTSGHIHSEIETGQHYHLKWDASKKVIVKDDTSLQACQLAQEWKSVRNDRNRKLAETDYLALKDSTLSTAMKTYRQALRDVPASNSDPKKVTWPTKPS